MYTDDMFVSEALKAGVKGYLQKDSAFEELARAIRTVVANQVYLSAKIAGSVVNGYVTKMLQEETADIVRLSGREREVLQLIAEGVSTKQMADRLNLSHKTIEYHRRNHHGKAGSSQHRRTHQICDPKKSDLLIVITSCPELMLENLSGSLYHTKFDALNPTVPTR